MRKWAPFLMVLGLSLLGIFDHDLWTPDEPRAAELSREFLEPGHSWAVPTLNGEPFLEKPPLVYWSSALSMKVFGVHAWAARLPCVLFGWGTLLFTFLLSRSLFGDEIAEGATLVLSTSLGFLLVSHHLESDAGLACFLAAAAYYFHRALRGAAGGYPAAAAALLGAFFSKGFIAFAFAAPLFVGWMVWTRSLSELRRPQPWLLVPALAVPIGLWLLALSRDPHPGLLRTFVIENHFGRFFGSSEARILGHHQPVYYYLLQLPVQFAPWILALVLWRPRLREEADRFLLLWLVPGLVLLTLSSTKRGIYLIPLLAPMAILTAREFAARGKARWILWASGGVAAALAIAAVAAGPRIDVHKSLRPACLAIPPGARIFALDPDETTRAVVPFYTGRYLTPVTDPDQVTGTNVALVLGPRSTPRDRERARAACPGISWEPPASHGHPLWVYSR